jgi:hypothetical protein
MLPMFNKLASKPAMKNPALFLEQFWLGGHMQLPLDSMLLL